MTQSIMQQLLEDARHAAARGEVPIAACVVGPDGTIVARASNEVETQQNVTAHAEMLAIQRACVARGSKYLMDCDLYVTLEPCAMCAQAISLAKMRRLTFAAYDPKGGGVEHGACVFAQPTCHHTPEVIGGVCEAEAGTLLKDFFAEKR
jgi:tRNA(adenine34) deaminase